MQTRFLKEKGNEIHRKKLNHLLLQKKILYFGTCYRNVPIMQITSNLFTIIFTHA